MAGSAESVALDAAERRLGEVFATGAVHAQLLRGGQESELVVVDGVATNELWVRFPGSRYRVTVTCDPEELEGDG